MQFTITIKINYVTHKLLVKRIFLSDRIERFEIVGKIRSVILESNRPLFRNKGLKHRKPNWKIIEGKVNNAHALEAAISAIYEYVER